MIPRTKRVDILVKLHKKSSSMYQFLTASSFLMTPIFASAKPRVTPKHSEEGTGLE